MTALAQLGRFGFFLYAVGLASTRNPPPLARAVEESYRIGVRSLPILVVISAFVGTNLAVQGFNAFAPARRPVDGRHVRRAGRRA